MFFIRKLICLLGIHKGYYVSHQFVDKVSKKDVNLYKCEWCEKKWLANTHLSRFKIYKEK